MMYNFAQALTKGKGIEGVRVSNQNFDKNKTGWSPMQPKES